jgi:hypothetical protein
MKQKPNSRRKRSTAKSVLRLPDLEHAKAAVLNSLNSMDAKRGYRHAIDEFVDWYCSEPRLAFNRIVVLRYRSHLESRQLAPGTINLRLGAVRRLAYEAADCGLLSADLAAGIRRVKGVKKLGVRLVAGSTVVEKFSSAGENRCLRCEDLLRDNMLVCFKNCGSVESLPIRIRAVGNCRIHRPTPNRTQWSLEDFRNIRLPITTFKFSRHTSV